MPKNVQLGIELHYDAEVDDNTAQAVADALVSNKLALAMITPGAHSHFAYGGICSLDRSERKAAEELGTRTVDLAYGTLRKAWNPDKPPAFVIWNGSFGYDVATVGDPDRCIRTSRRASPACASTRPRRAASFASRSSPSPTRDTRRC